MGKKKQKKPNEQAESSRTIYVKTPKLAHKLPIVTGSHEPVNWSGRLSDDLSLSEQSEWEDAAKRRMDRLWNQSTR